MQFLGKIDFASDSRRIEMNRGESCVWTSSHVERNSAGLNRFYSFCDGQVARGDIHLQGIDLFLAFVADSKARPSGPLKSMCRVALTPQ